MLIHRWGESTLAAGLRVAHHCEWEQPVQAAANRVLPTDRSAHEWYRFVLSFPPHLVRDYVGRFGLGPRHTVLDPFCGTGTTLVECKKLGIPSVGVEANPMAHFASRVKVDWTPDARGLVTHAAQVAADARAGLAAAGLEDEPPIFEGCLQVLPEEPLRALGDEQSRLLLTDSISPLPLHKVLTLCDCMARQEGLRYQDHERLALASAVVASASNLKFGPEVGVGPPKPDAAAVGPWLAGVKQMGRDLQDLAGLAHVAATAHLADSRAVAEVLPAGSIDAVITSPPYPNEKDYTRTTRLESVLLGFLATRSDLRAMKKHLVRSNTRGVYRADADDELVASHEGIARIADEIERRRLELGKTSGFERMYARLTKLYFGGMKRHFMGLRRVLRPGARLAYVVGDQASYLRVMIRTGQLLAEIAESVGYTVLGIDLFRTRFSTATGEHLREEVVLLRWAGA